MAPRARAAVPSIAKVAREVSKAQPAVPQIKLVAEAETMGRAAGAYYHALLANGIPKSVALHMLRDWAVGGPAAPGEPEQRELA